MELEPTVRSRGACHPEVRSEFTSPDPSSRDALPDQVAFLQGLIRGMRCGVLTVDTELRLLMINDQARETLELPTLPPPGTSLVTALRHYPQLVQLLRESFAMTSLPNRAELDIEPPGRDRKSIGFTISLVRRADGTALGASIFFKDLTQIEHREEQERLKERLVALGQMAASMAHEIRNPLAAIDVSCSLLKRRLTSDPDGMELLNKVTAEVQRLNRTVNSSLEFVRPIQLSLGYAPLRPLLEEAIQVARDRRAEPGILVETEFCDEDPPFQMDRALLRQVFVNLVLNALEAVEAGGRVTVSTDRIGVPKEGSVPYQPDGARIQDPWQKIEHFAVIRVADDGAGITDEARNRVFYPFFTTKKNGSGVGLSTSKKIVDSHRGLIDVNNNPGGGALFTVRLPMVLETAEV